MNNRVLGTVMLVASLLASAESPASSAVTARVLGFGTYGNGNVYVALDQTINESGCASAYLELAANAAAAKSVLATAALALAAGTTVTVQTDGCLNGIPSFTGARSAYFVANH